MNIVIYARYSSHNQTEQSIEGQLAVCYEFAKRNNYTVIREYIDRAMTGTNDNRANFQKMIEDSKSKTFQGVLVYQLDRFSRDRYDSVVNKRKLKQNGVSVISAKENISNDPSGVLLEAMMEGINEYYSLELSQKIKRGYDNSASKLQFLGGNCGLGYKVNKNTRKLEIDTKTAPYVKKIFEMYASGYTIKEICDYLNERNIKTSIGNPFNKNSLRGILSNKKYIGIYTYHDKETKDGIPRIISDELFAEVEKIVNKNKKVSRNTRAKEEYLLTTKLFCGHCKEMMIGISGTSKTGKLHSYYTCTKARKKLCDKKTIKKKLIEDIVIKACRDILTTKNIDKIAKAVVALCKKDVDNLIVKDLKHSLKSLEKQKNNLLQTLKNGANKKVQEIIFSELEQLSFKEDDIKKDILKEELQHVRLEIPQVKFFLNDLKNGNINDEKYRHALVTVLINKIFLYDDKLTIFFNTQDRSIEITEDLLNETESSYKGKSAPSF